MGTEKQHTMMHKHCIICFEEYFQEVSKETEIEGKEENCGTKSFNFLEQDSGDCVILRKQLPVIFILRELLEVPEEKCMQFLRDHGNPCSWIYWCDSCSVLIHKAKVLFDSIIQLRRKFELLQAKSRHKIVETSGNLPNDSEMLLNAKTEQNQSEPTTIVRDWIFQKSQTASISMEAAITSSYLKIERADSGKEESDSCSMLNVKLELHSDASEGCVPIKKKVKRIRKRSSKSKKSKASSSTKSENSESVTEEKKVYTCKYCPKEFAHSGSLVIHERIHTGEKPYSCKLCEKQFRASSDLTKHEKIHNGIKPFSCEDCGKSFYLRPDLRKHARIHTGERNFCCEICGKNFGTAKTLRNHVMTHTGDKPRLCTVCGKRFVNNQQLTRHLRTHTGERPYACSYCEKRFYDLGGVQKHEMLHRGEKPFVCATCGLRFTQSSALYCHQRTHLGEKPYKCTVCERQFTQSSTLKIHSRTHTGERPFACTTCGKQFITKSSLTVHQKNHTGQKDHCCSVCGKLFPQLYGLNRHLKKVHLVTNESLKMKSQPVDPQLLQPESQPSSYPPPTLFTEAPSEYAMFSKRDPVT